MKTTDAHAFVGTSILISATDPSWAPVAAKNIQATLIDHAHCEKKAAASAISMINTYPEDTELVRAMTALASEEMSHFREVYEVLVELGCTLPRDEGDPYVQALLKESRTSSPQLRKLDRLLISALIEARSCERFQLLARELEERGENATADLFARFERSEAGHAALFVRLASRDIEDQALARLDQLAKREAAIVAELPIVARIH